MTLMLSCTLAGCAGGKKSQKEDDVPEEAGEGNVTLLLPPSKEDASRNRVLKLTIDGKDYTEPKTTKKKLVKVDPAEGKDAIEIVVSFWPLIYSNTIRTRKVQMKKGEEVIVDLSEEDPDQPDRYEAIFFQTPQVVVDEMMKLARVGKDDTIM